jgi:hypothetical protein
MRSKTMNHLHTTSDQSSSAVRSSHVGARCLPDALPVLRQAHVSLVRFEYSGQAGARRIRPTTFHEDSGRVIDAGLPTRLRKDIDVFLHELLDLRFPDWADAEGSRGELEWDIAADELEHRHSLRQITYETVTVRGLEPAIV